MNNVVAIDPGKKHLGWAEFVGGRLVACGLAEGKARDMRLALEEVGLRREVTVVEEPQIYPARRWKGDPNDLVDVALTAGIAIGTLCRRGEVVCVRPRAWGGNRPKTVKAAGIVGALDEAERDVLNGCGVARGKLHNVVDATGIGLWWLGRYGR